MFQMGTIRRQPLTVTEQIEAAGEADINHATSSRPRRAIPTPV